LKTYDCTTTWSGLVQTTELESNSHDWRPRDILSAGGFGVIELRPRQASEAKPPGGPGVNAKTPPEGWSSLSTIEKLSLEGLFW
jgi:hypothetical protein